MVEELHDHHRDYIIQQRIDQFYYMQTQEELKLLSEQLVDTSLRLAAFQKALDNKYLEAYFKWSSDVRWLKRYIAKLDEEGDERVSVL